MNETRQISRFYLAIILVLIFSNAVMFCIMVSTDKKNEQLEQRLNERDTYDQDLWYSFQ